MLFLTLFLDLVGFSIIFPLFPEILEYYLAREGADSLVGRFVSSLQEWAGTSDVHDWRIHVLFGGALGSLYSLLQFICSPLWGRLSDRIGRRPVLLVTVAGLGISYVLWIFASTFALLIASRLLGGIMAGNISTATAAMADVTTPENRARGMGMIGAAFGLGFILGPAIGGALAGWDLSAGDPDSLWNPFSAAACGALLLSICNLIWVIRAFGETLPPEKRGTSREIRPLHPRALLGLDLEPAARRTNLAYFVFLLAFGGMEFTLTFLARDRLNWSAGQQALMFVYVGVLIAGVQGGVVRRLVPIWGERKVASLGLVLVIPGLLGLAWAQNAWVLYAGLTPMAIGSALTIPSFTALVSLYSPSTRQGAALGAFRSLGALARAVGPLAAAVAYWRFGPSVPYLAGAGILIIPILMTSTLPPASKDGESTPSEAG